jgi:hypothetical protein
MANETAVLKALAKLVCCRLKDRVALDPFPWRTH